MDDLRPVTCLTCTQPYELSESSAISATTELGQHCSIMVMEFGFHATVALDYQAGV